MSFVGSGLDQERPGSSEENYSSGCESDQVSVKLSLLKVKLSDMQTHLKLLIVSLCACVCQDEQRGQADVRVGLV